jgi:hypothetical protein
MPFEPAHQSTVSSARTRGSFKDHAKRTAISESDLKSLKTLYAKYGAKLVGAELNRIAEGPPARRAGAPAKIHPMSHVAVYLDIEERRALKNGKARRRVLSVSKACEELAEVLNAVTVDVRYASKSLQAMYRKGKELLKGDTVPAPAFVTLGSSGGREVKIPFISTAITSDYVQGPVIDRLGRGGLD